jgi:hypothetical protein
VHLGKGNQALDSMGLLGFMFGDLELDRGFLGRNSVFAGGN